MSTPKFLQSFFLTLLIPICASAQQNVGIGTTTPNTSAILDVTSTNKGMLVPRLTTTQMNAIASPANGLLVYNTDSTAFAYRSGTSWVYLEGKSNASNDWSTKGNTGTSPASSFIGTTDDQDVIFKRNNVRAGLLNNSAENSSFGVGALNTASTGTNNTAIGKLVLGSNTTGHHNTAIGAYALRNNTEGIDNTATGEGALFSNTTGTGNTAHGFQALVNNTTSFGNTASGVQALRNNTTGSNNTANGTGALYNNMTGNGNTTHGFQALFSNTTGNSNTANGFQALFSNTTRSNLVAVGDSALYNNGVGVTQSFEATLNTAVGSKALFSNNTGYSNTATGRQALFSNTSGFQNTANGVDALKNNTTGYRNTAVGRNALLSNNSGFQNAAIGDGSLAANTTGNNNVAHGRAALGSNTVGNANVAIGINALFSNTNQSNLVAIGDSALLNNGIGATLPFHATKNTAIGSKALFGNTLGDDNTAVGFSALKTNTTGVNNTAVGTQALENFNSGFNNVAMGVDAMRNKTSGGNNVALGTGAMANNIIGGNNTAVGVDAGSASTGSGNVFLGYTAGQNESGNNKLYISNDNSNSDNALIYGEFDNDRLQVNGTLGIGRFAGTYPLAIRAKFATHLLATFFDANDDPSFSLNLLGNGTRLNFTDASNASRLAIDDNGYIGMDIDDPIADLHIKEANEAYAPGGINNNGGIRMERASTTDSWNILVDNENDFDYNFNGVTKGYISHLDGAYFALSDKRVKRNIAPLTSVLSNVLLLEPKTYHYKDNKADVLLSYGFIAQEVEKLFPDFVDTKGPDGMKAIAYQNFSVVAIQAIKEQQVIIEAEKLHIDKLNVQVKSLEEEVKIEKLHNDKLNDKVKSLEEKFVKLEEMVKALMEK